MKIRDDFYLTYLRTGPVGNVKASLVQGEPPHELLADRWGGYARVIIRLNAHVDTGAVCVLAADDEALVNMALSSPAAA